MSESRWITFVEDTPQAWVTRYWKVLSKEGGNFLGGIKWFGAWRKYCFFPEQATIFEQDCLRDIADFCEAQTYGRKAERAIEKESGGPARANAGKHLVR